VAVELEWNEVVKHYSRVDVREEIARWCNVVVAGAEGPKPRWVGIHCSEVDSRGRRILIRYFKRIPLKIRSAREVESLLRAFKRFKPRTFYATANIYRELSKVDHVFDIGNIIACTPTWDIDNTRLKWRATIEVCREIVSFLENRGISKSIIIKWSGNAAHVHIHHQALSPEIRAKRNPVGFSLRLSGVCD